MVDSKRQTELAEIGDLMRRAGLPADFVKSAVTTATEFDGVFDLMVIWRDEDNDQERQEVIADIQEMVDDCAQTEKNEADKIRCDDLEQYISEREADNPGFSELVATAERRRCRKVEPK